MNKNEKAHTSTPPAHDEFKVRRTGATAVRGQDEHESFRHLGDFLIAPGGYGTDAPAQTYLLLGETIALMPDDQALVVSQRHWERVRDRVAEFGTITNDWAAATWGFVGIATAALVAILAPIEAILIPVVVAGFLAAALCFAIGHQLHRSRQDEGADIVDEMDTIVGALNGRHHRD